MIDTLRLAIQGKPLMIAHRGLSALEKENSASAFVAAAQRSYYGIETDVHRTLDGQYIIIHDDHTGRVAGDDYLVEETPFDTLRSLRLIDTDGRKGRGDLILPSLQEYASICKKYEKISVLELKNHFEDEDIRRIIDVVRGEGQLENTIFISFDLPNLISLRRMLPDQPAQYLVKDMSDDLPQTLLKYRLDIDIDYRSLTEEAMKALKEAGVKVNVWTVNTEEDALRMTALGVDYITTNILE